MIKEQIKKYFDEIASERDNWYKKSKYYHNDIKNFLRFLIPEDVSILEIGCSTGEISNFLYKKNKKIKGIDFSQKSIEIAKKKYPKIDFEVMDAENIALKEKYDYIIMSDLIGFLEDILEAFQQLHKIIHPKSRLIITYYNFLWQPILKIGGKLKLKMSEPIGNWLSKEDVFNLLSLANFEVIKSGQRLLIPFYIPILSNLINRYLSKLPIFRHFCLVYYIVARPAPDLFKKEKEFKVSVIVPARNEKGNIESIVLRMPNLGSATEIIFVEGHSTDNTLEEIRRVKNKYPQKNIQILVQDGKGKADAVRKGFDNARGDILMILDADLTVAPEELEKFYFIIKNGLADFVNGCRLVYPLGKEAMKVLNLVGNKFFSVMFSWLLDQRIKDTLCGTKVLWREDYEKIKKGRKFFGEFDPFGDFDLIFGASKLNLKIVDLPIRYQKRQYGKTNISRFTHGLLLLKMCFFAMRKIKFV